MTARDRTVLGVVVGVALLAAYWFLLLAPKREEARKLGTQVSAAAQKATKARAQLTAAQGAKRDYSHNYATIARLGQAVPADDNVPSLVYQLEAAARATHVDFRAVKLTGTSAVATATPTATSSSSTGSTGSSSSTGSTGSSSSTGSTGSTSSSTTGTTSTPTTTPAPATQAATATLPPGAAVGPAGFPTMPFSLTFDGSFFHMAAFFHRLESFVEAGGHTVRVGGRLLTLDGISFSAGRRGFPRVKAVVAATAYLIPEGESVTGGATATSGATSTSSSGSTSATPPAATVAPLVP